MPRYLIRKQHAAPSSTAVTASSNDLDAALNAAWQLQRYYEVPVEIIDTQFGHIQVAVVNVEWVD